MCHFVLVHLFLDLGIFPILKILSLTRFVSILTTTLALVCVELEEIILKTTRLSNLKLKGL